MMKSSRNVNARDPAMEAYYGRPKTNDFIVGNLPFIGQVAPLVRERMRAAHGRYLSGTEGFSGDSIDGAVGTDPAYESQALDELESQDDVFGSGIFDSAGRGPTSNASMGVFASHYALPGFVAREVPFTVSKDITDITDNADVVMVPGGGMTFAEVRGQMVPPSRRLGEPTRGPGLRVSGPTTRAQVYKSLEAFGAPVTNMRSDCPTLREAKQSQFKMQESKCCQSHGYPPGTPIYIDTSSGSIECSRRGLVFQRASSQSMGDTYPGRPLAVSQYRQRPVQNSTGQRMVPFQYGQRVMGQQSIVNPMDATLPIGATDEPASPGKMAFWGVLLGAAVGGVVVLATRKK